MGFRLRGHNSSAVGEGQIGVGCVGVQGDVIVIWAHRKSMSDYNVNLEPNGDSAL